MGGGGKAFLFQGEMPLGGGGRGLWVRRGDMMCIPQTPILNYQKHLYSGLWPEDQPRLESKADGNVRAEAAS